MFSNSDLIYNSARIQFFSDYTLDFVIRQIVFEVCRKREDS